MRYRCNRVKKALEKGLAVLTDRERAVITMYYFEELNFPEIAKVLGVSQSRTSQIHIKALKKLKEEMKEYEEVFHTIF